MGKAKGEDTGQWRGQSQKGGHKKGWEEKRQQYCKETQKRE